MQIAAKCFRVITRFGYIEKNIFCFGKDYAVAVVQLHVQLK